jgi:peptidoglycan/LPS O-acetylase OafA/YrhL
MATVGGSCDRVPQLDVLRGAAILLVLGSHPAVKIDQAGSFWPVALMWYRVGWTGVDLFFVLSGYLVGGLLIAEHAATGRIDAWRFWARRAWKIWPPYFVYLAVFALVAVPAGLPLSGLVPNLIHAQNYLGSPAGHTWSLAVEEHFYLALPLALTPLLASGRARLALAIFAAIALGCAVGRYLQSPRVLEIRTHLRADSLAFGVALAWAMQARGSLIGLATSRPTATLGAGLILIGVAFVIPEGSPLAPCFVATMLYLGYGAVVVAAVSGPIPCNPLSRAVGFVGVHSYAIYLWHIEGAYGFVNPLIAAGPLGSMTWIFGVSAYIGLAVGVGVLMTRCVERPALAIRDRLVPRAVTSRTLPASGSSATV